MREMRSVIVYSAGRKITLPAEKIIVTVRDPSMKQIQASMDITVPNIEVMQKMIRREP